MFPRAAAVLIGWLVLASTVAALVPQVALAQAAAPPDGLKKGFEFVFGKEGDLGVRHFDSISSFILAILAVVGGVIAVVALAALLYGAVLYITSLGDEGKAEKAKQVIMYAIIGLLILGAAGIVVNVVINLIRVPAP